VGDFRGYLRLARASVLAQTERPLLFWGSVVGASFSVMAEGAGIYLLVHTFGRIGGWTPSQVLVLYAITLLGFALFSTFCYSLHSPNFASLLRTGAFDRALNLPIRPLVWLLGSDLQTRELGRFVLGVGLLAWAGGDAGVRWSPGSLAVLAMACACTALVLFGISLAGVAMSFHTRQATEFVTVLAFGGLNLAAYPLQVFDTLLRMVFVYLVPVGLTVYVPALWLLGKHGPAWAGRGLLPLVPVLTAAACAGGLLAYRAGLRHYLEVG
jgi:ABC-2 type transport system permease protein